MQVWKRIVMKKTRALTFLWIFACSTLCATDNITPNSGFLFSQPIEMIEDFFNLFRTHASANRIEEEDNCQKISDVEATAPQTQGITGFWETVNQSTGKPQGVVAIYEYKGNYYGRLIGTYNAEGKIDDSIYKPVERAPGIQGNPPYCGLDFIWNLRRSGSRYKGKVIDPKKGNVYDAELWTRNGNLILRGKVLVFGKNLTWPPAHHSVFTSGFKMPDLATFVPSRPRVN